MAEQFSGLSLSRAAFVTICVLSVVGCGSGTTEPSGSTPTYLFSTGPPSSWLKVFSANDLPTATSIGETLETFTDIATDGSGNVVGTGYDLGSLGGTSNPGQVLEGFVAKYDSTGAQTWVRQLGTGDGDTLYGVAVDTSGNIYASGTTLGALPGFTNASHTLEATLYKFDANGALLWQTEFAVDSAYTDARAISCDPQGDPIVGGDYSAHNLPQSSLIYIRKFDSMSGSAVWTSTIGTNSLDSMEKLTTDEVGQVYLTGETTGPFPGGTTGSGVSFVASMSGAGGQLLWEQTITNSGFSITAPFAVSAKNGVVAVAGSTGNTLVTRGFNADSYDTAFLATFQSTTGTLKWSKTYSTGTGDQFTGVSIADSGSIFVSGTTNGLLAPGFTAVTNDVFLLKVGSDESNVWASQFGTGLIVNQSVPFGPLVSVSDSGKVYVGGEVQAPYAGYSNPTNVAQMFVAQFSQ